ncbi:MAG: hypothetical protein H0V27_15520 [Pyrinomonadaceae bacterium]|jgi:type II secretory pathway pseudopilin PulG|nr:hypothetical protein [Pyrinomonadaceae bacterium]
MRAAPLKQTRRSEEGYTLIALLALAAIMMIFITAAAPMLRQQAQRERELEAIRRGEEVAEAIRQYIRINNGVAPTSWEQLQEGVSRGTKKVQILRTSAARDPLSKSGEWRLIRPTDQAMIDFQRDLASYTRSTGQVPTNDPLLISKRELFPPPVISTNNASSDQPCNAAGDEDETENGTGQFIGVASRSRRCSVVNYYGINHHDGWIFTPLFR